MDMFRHLAQFLVSWAFALLAIPATAVPPGAVVTVKNPIDLARLSETIVLQAAELRTLLAVDDVRKVHVRDEKSGQELLVQAVDTNDDGKYEEFLFQSDLAPQETRRFVLTVGQRQVARREDFKAYGRFVQERRDDFAWENDRIAHRMYGLALESWAQEPLTSSAVDVWTKRVRRLVVNDWYMTDDYHQDHGEGADLYSAGSSRGCGGNGMWVNGKLYPSTNFRGSRLLANGPIRVLFELTYPAWDASGLRVSEVKRITLDAGQNLDRFESRYTFSGSSPDAQYAIGIKKAPKSVKVFTRDAATLRTWEPLKVGELGCGIVLDPASITDFAEDKSNYLIIAKIPADGAVVYYAGFGWDKSGDFRNAEDWDSYIAGYGRRLKSPVQVTLTAK
jgi:Domain of unknown function (DUF4861)